MIVRTLHTVAILLNGALACGRPLELHTVPPLGGSDGSSAGAVETTVLLLGDAGWATADDPILARVAAHAAQRPDRTVVVFLGDNVYPDGLAAEGLPDRQRGEGILSVQLQVGKRSGARLIFVPGNHDWDRGHEKGWDEILEEGRFLERNGAELLPGGGCPGPHVVDEGDQVRIIALDTQWWLHEHAKPVHPTSACPHDSEPEVLTALGQALSGAGSRHVLVVGHHPLASEGVHAGHFTWKDHIFPLTNLASWLWLPLPIVGSIYPLVRSAGVTSQDLSNARNGRMRTALDSVLGEHRPLIYAAGHDHSLQVLVGETVRYYLVSGASTVGHTSPVGRGDQTRYAREITGFMRVDVTTDGRVRLGVVVVDEDGNETEEYSAWLSTQ